MRLTREKIVRISHQIVDVLVQSNEVEFIEDRDTIRQHMVQTMTNILREEEKIEVEVRKKISSQKKEILEGSEEWDLLFRKYYSDELRRAGIAAAPEEHQKAGHGGHRYPFLRIGRYWVFRKYRTRASSDIGSAS